MSFKKVVTFPWEAQAKDGTAKVREIFDDLQHERGFSPCFQRKPESQEVLQSIALPTVMAQVHGKTYALKERNLLYKLPKPDRQEIYAELGMTMDQMVPLFLLRNVRLIDVMASYVAATYAVTTHTHVYWLDFKDLIQLCLESTMADTPVFKAVESVGLLIVKYPLGIYPGWEKASGSIFSLLANRISAGKITVLMDTVAPPCLDTVESGLLPSKAQYREMIKSAAIANSKLEYFLVGPNTKLVWPSGLKEQSSPSTVTGSPSGDVHVGRKTPLI